MVAHQPPPIATTLATLGQKKSFAYTGTLNLGHDIVIYRSPTANRVGFFNHRTDLDNRILWSTAYRFSGETVHINSLHSWIGGYYGRTSISQQVVAILQHQGLVVEQPVGSKLYFFPTSRINLW